MNDILPLLTVKRSDGADVYEYANEEFQKAVERICESALPEVIRRFRISLISWYDSVDQKSDGYEGQWAFYVKKLLLADEYARRLNMQNEEMYIKTVLNMRIKTPNTVYGKWISDTFDIHIVKLLESLHFGPVKKLGRMELHWIRMSLDDLQIWKNPYRNALIQCKYEFLNKLIDHCKKHQQIDVWFQYLVLEKTSIRGEYTDLTAFEKIVEVWNDEKLADYLIQSVEADLTEKNELTYAVYLEVLLDVVSDEKIKNKILYCLIHVYQFYTKKNFGDSSRMLFEGIRRKKMLVVLAEAHKNKSFQLSELDPLWKIFEEEYVLQTVVFRLWQCCDNMKRSTPEEVLGQLENVLLRPFQLEFEVKDEDGLYQAFERLGLI